MANAAITLFLLRDNAQRLVGLETDRYRARDLKNALQDEGVDCRGWSEIEVEVAEPFRPQALVAVAVHPQLRDAVEGWEVEVRKLREALANISDADRDIPLAEQILEGMATEMRATLKAFDGQR